METKLEIVNDDYYEVEDDDESQYEIVFLKNGRAVHVEEVTAEEFNEVLRCYSNMDESF